ncbi:MAG: hypothetical protein LDL31_08195, partial [Prosthecobacter sp.]|nr:hypothetical protein [Prosthecobacter sp.]
MRFYPHFLFSLLPALAAAAVPDFEKEIAPILEARCLSCHDATQKKGDVSLDTHANALASIMRGKPDESPLIDQISGSKPKMP